MNHNNYYYMNSIQNSNCIIIVSADGLAILDFMVLCCCPIFSCCGKFEIDYKVLYNYLNKDFPFEVRTP